MSTTYEFPWPPKELSPNARVHWAKLARVKREYKEACGWVVLEARSLSRRLGLLVTPRLKPLVTAQVTFVVTDSRRRDADNYMAMLKPMWDALVELKVLVDDSHDKLTIEKPEWVRGKEKRVIVRLNTPVSRREP